LYWNLIPIIERMIAVSVDLSDCLPYITLIKYIQNFKIVLNTFFQKLKDSF